MRPALDAGSGVMACCCRGQCQPGHCRGTPKPPDLLQPAKLGGGAAPLPLEYRGAMLAIGAGGFVLAGSLGCRWPPGRRRPGCLARGASPWRRTAAPIVHPVRPLRRVWGRRRISAPAQAAAGAADPLTVLSTLA